MATEESKRKMERLARSYDSIMLHPQKGVHALLRLRALQEGIPINELAERAVTARCGLRMLPYPKQMEQVAKCTTQQQAAVMIRKLQLQEQANEIIDMVCAEPGKTEYEAVLDDSDRYELAQVLGSMTEMLSAPAGDDGTVVKLNGYQLGIMRRFLSNVTSTEE